MKLQNKSKEKLTAEQEDAVCEAGAKIERTFGKKVYAAYIKPDIKNSNRLYAVTFAFDFKENN